MPKSEGGRTPKAGQAVTSVERTIATFGFRTSDLGFQLVLIHGHSRVDDHTAAKRV